MKLKFTTKEVIFKNLGSVKCGLHGFKSAKRQLLYQLFLLKS